MSTNRQLAKSAATVGGMTAISRVLGFVRDLVIASAFGTGVAAEAFVVSFKLPNLLRDLVGEGAANAAIVPVLTHTKEKEPLDFWPLVSTLVVYMGIILAVFSVLGCIFADKVVYLMAPGFARSADPEKFPLAVQLTRVIFPYIFLIGMSALAMGILNSLREFKSSAMGPILMNLCLILFGFFLEPIFGPMALVIGVLAGGILQLLWQMPALSQIGFHFSKPNLKHPGAKRIGRLLLPRALGSALYQINIFTDSIIASFESIVGPGGQSALYYSNRLFQLPLAIVGVSLAQTLLPTFSSQMAKKDMEGFRHTFSSSVRMVCLIVLPAAAGLIVLSVPIIRIIFQHGKFDAYSTSITSAALFYYGFGLLSCCLIKMLANAFYAMHDTRTPVRIMFIAVALNVVLSLCFMKFLKIGGLALASSISATVNAGLLYLALKKKIGDLGEAEIVKSFLKIFPIALAMGVVLFGLSQSLLQNTSSSKWLQSLMLFTVIALSVMFYYVACRLLKVEELRTILKHYGRKNTPSIS